MAEEPARVIYSGNGSTTDFTIPFSYIDGAHVLAKVNGVPTPFTFFTASTVRFASAPASGAPVLIYRHTSAEPLVVFDANSVEGVIEDTLNLAIKQARMVAEEARVVADAMLGVEDAVAASDLAVSSAASAAASAAAAAASAASLQGALPPHTHPISDVTTLQTALNAKADASAMTTALAGKQDTSANLTAWSGITTASKQAYRSLLGSASGLGITNDATTPTTKLTVSVAEAVLLNTTADAIRVGAQSLTLNAATVGANGLDAGSLAASTWYYVWLINNGTTTACLLSLSQTAPTMPSGYTYKLRVGAVLTVAAATFIRYKQVGNVARYQVVAASTTPALPTMQMGVVGNLTTPTWVAVSVAPFVPPTASRIAVILGGSYNSWSMVAPNNSYGAYTSTTNPPFYTIQGTWMFDLILESSNIYTAIGNATNGLWCMGWTDNVNAT